MEVLHPQSALVLLWRMELSRFCHQMPWSFPQSSYPISLKNKSTGLVQHLLGKAQGQPPISHLCNPVSSITNASCILYWITLLLPSIHCLNITSSERFSLSPPTELVTGGMIQQEKIVCVCVWGCVLLNQGGLGLNTGLGNYQLHDLGHII